MDCLLGSNCIIDRQTLLSSWSWVSNMVYDLSFLKHPVSFMTWCFKIVIWVQNCRLGLFDASGKDFLHLEQPWHSPSILLFYGFFLLGLVHVYEAAFVITVPWLDCRGFINHCSVCLLYRSICLWWESYDRS